MYTKLLSDKIFHESGVLLCPLIKGSEPFSSLETYNDDDDTDGRQRRGAEPHSKPHHHTKHQMAETSSSSSDEEAFQSKVLFLSSAGLDAAPRGKRVELVEEVTALICGAAIEADDDGDAKEESGRGNVRYCEELGLGGLGIKAGEFL